MKMCHYFSREEKLGPYNGEHLIAHLPEGKTLADYTWISVWCRQASVSVYKDRFNPNLKIGSLRK